MSRFVAVITISPQTQQFKSPKSPVSPVLTTPLIASPLPSSESAMVSGESDGTLSGELVRFIISSVAIACAGGCGVARPGKLASSSSMRWLMFFDIILSGPKRNLSASSSNRRSSAADVGLLECSSLIAFFSTGSTSCAAAAAAAIFAAIIGC